MRINHPHSCGRTHRSFQSLSECLWHDEAPVITGDGPVALLARCDLLTIALFANVERARRRKQRLDTVGCGSACEGLHEIIVLVPELHAPADAGSLRP